MYKSKFLALAFGVGLLSTGAYADARIVVVGPMSGQFANYWPQIEAAGKAAEIVINENGGVLGGKLVVEYGDDACDPKQAVSLANRNVQEQYDVVIGHFCSGSSISASDVYNEEEILMISGASVNSTLTDRGLPYVFRTVGRDDQQGRAAADAILSGEYGKKVALVHDKSAFGQGLVDKTKGFMVEVGLEPAFEDSITAGENDYSALVTRVINEGIDVFYFGGYHREAGLLVRQLKEAGFEGGTFISGDGIKAQEFVTIAGDASNGVLFTFFPDARELPAAQQVLPVLKDIGSDGDGFTLYIYAAIQAYVDAVAKAGTNDVPAVADALRDGTYETAVGELDFNEKGDVDRNLYRLYEWKDGEIVEAGM